VHINPWREDGVESVGLPVFFQYSFLMSSPYFNKIKKGAVFFKGNVNKTTTTKKKERSQKRSYITLNLYVII
jgi:hypothetical protein